MKLVIAGGCGEHGRNCFLVKGSRSFLVDAGIGEDGKYPYLSLEDIAKIDYIFLTHSHKDHTGAIPFLLKNGFSGTVIASSETLQQIDIDYDRLCLACDGVTLPGFSFEYGRSGHCPGSLIHMDGRTLFFSGDYREDDPVFISDPARGISADIAIIDSAYGYSSFLPASLRDELASYCRKNRLVLLPVPLYGRGISILSMLDDVKCYGDEHFLSELNRHHDGDYWCRRIENKASIYISDINEGVVFLSDPQLKKEASMALVDEIIGKQGSVILTGHPDRGGNAERLLMEGKAAFMRYPVHQNYEECIELSNRNSFGSVIFYHSEEIAPSGSIFTL